MRLWILPLLSGCLALAACAGSTESPTTDAAGRSCFWTRNISSFSAQDRETVNVRVGVRDVFQLTLLAPCPEVNWSQRIAIQSRGSSQICTGLDATVIAPSPTGPVRCAVRDVRRLTADEVAALPGRARP